MKVVIFGLGYVGCTAAGCIASQGHVVHGVDVSEAKVAAIMAGQSPVHEPGLGELIAAARNDGRLSASRAIGDSLDDADLAIVCVGTPSGVDGAHDMRYIVQVTRDIAEAIAGTRDRSLTVAYRSTMRPGSTELLIAPIFERALGPGWNDRVELAYNPEFLREANAIADYFHPPKIVVGTIGGARSEAMEALHEGIEAPVFRVGIREAELTKFVDNTSRLSRFRFATRRCFALSPSSSSSWRGLPRSLREGGLRHD